MSIPANPPPTKLPEKLDRDFELRGFFNDLLRSLYMIWARTGSGAGTVPPAGLPPPIESIANLTTVADDMLYTTAPDTYATSTIEAVGRAFLAEATIADERDYLGLVAGGAGDIWVEKAGDTMTGDLNIDTDLSVTGTATLGGLRLSDTSWEDLRFPATGNRLDSAATRYSFDFTELGVSFDNNSRYTNEQLSFIAQMPHSWKEGTTLDVHLHWIQNQAAIPNWLLAYRVYNNGEDPGAYAELPWDAHAITYTSGTICQVTDFPAITMTGKTISCIMDFKLWRDTTNASGEFAGNDPVATAALLKEMDIHYEVDSLGSNTEYVKGT
jgi:hypothetical protein